MRAREFQTLCVMSCSDLSNCQEFFEGNSRNTEKESVEEGIVIDRAITDEEQIEDERAMSFNTIVVLLSQSYTRGVIHPVMTESERSVVYPGTLLA